MSETVMDAQHQSALLKATQVAEILNISRAMTYQLMQRNEIRTVQIGTARRVRQQDLEDFILRNLTTRRIQK